MSAPPRFLVFRHLVLVLSFSSPTAQKQYVPVDPVDPSVRQRTIALLNRGDARGALRLLQASMKRPANTLDDGMTPSLWHYAGLANHMIDDLESAEVAYSKAVQFDRRDVQSWMNLGECALYQWKGDVALAGIRRDLSQNAVMVSRSEGEWRSTRINCGEQGFYHAFPLTDASRYAVVAYSAEGNYLFCQLDFWTHEQTRTWVESPNPAVPVDELQIRWGDGSNYVIRTRTGEDVFRSSMDEETDR